MSDGTQEIRQPAGGESTQHTSPPDADIYALPVVDGMTAARRGWKGPLLAIVGAFVLAGIVAAAIVLANSGGSSKSTLLSSSSTPTSTTPPASTGTTVRAVSVSTLKTLPASLGHPVYWAGPLPDATYELTQSPDGRVYVRYLTGGAQVGSPLPNFLTVGTYVVPNAEAAVRAAAAQPGAVHVPVRGGVGFYNRARPTSVYFAYPGSNIQVETYDPSPAVARRLVERGLIKPVG
jgi:hypothetical protein